MWRLTKHILEEKDLFYGVIVRTFWMTLVRGYTDNKKKMILNLYNFFLDTLKNLNDQMFGNLFIFPLLKFGENQLKLWYIFFIFWDHYKNDKMEPNRVTSYYYM